MEQNAFIFLKKEFPEIYELCKNCEISVVENRYGDAGNNSRKALEKILKDIINIEDKTIINHITIKGSFDTTNKGVSELLSYIKKHNFIIHSIKNDCYNLKELGNKASHHTDEEFTQNDARTAHELLFKIARYFYRKYSEERNEVNIYPGILYNNSEKPETISKRKILVDKSNFKQISGSYLLGELSKLKDSSHEAVEGYESLSNFKKYLHIDRSIQIELINKLKEVSNTSNNNLIMLCGSVGDGKSHLLAYLNENESELMKNFNIWNDATESDDPFESCIDTLAKRLSNFDDEHINTSNEKLIISINLGVLNNFIDSDYAKKRYKKLTSILNDLNIFDVNDFSMNFNKDPVSIISFSDYNIFEFNEYNINKVDSQYLTSIFERITNDDDNNPFYQAYLMDKTNKLNSPILYNYELFSQKNVQEIIIINLIKIIIKYKKIISTRELLNFVYEILVPSNVEIYESNVSAINYIESLLPNLLFNSINRCHILEIMHIEDPILKRNEIIDEILMKLNVSLDVPEVLSEYMDVKAIDFLMKAFGNHYNIRELDEEDKTIIVSSLIRFLNIFGNKIIKDLFTKKSYLDYVNYLYNYNYGNISELRILYKDIESAIFKWKGKLDNKNLCIDQIDNFKISKQFNLKNIGNENKIINENNLNRFKTVIDLEFGVMENQNDSVRLNLDYSLYEVITKLNKGYKPNKIEQKDLLLFNEFIDELINLNTSKQFLINNTTNDINFDFELDDFGHYIFKKV